MSRFWMLLLVVLLLVGCTGGTPPQVVVQSYGAAEAPGTDNSTLGATATEVAGLQQVQVRPSGGNTCGDIAAWYGFTAGCYNAANAREVPVGSGSCVQSVDCACCFLYGVPPGASAGYLSALAKEQEVQTPEQTPEPSPEPSPLPSLSSLPDAPLILSVNTGLKVTGFLLIFLIGSIVIIEMELVKKAWMPFLGIAYTIFFGVAMTHIWGGIVPFTMPELTGVRETAGWVLCLLLAGGGAYLVKSEQVSSKEDKLGYLLLMLAGAGLHVVLSMGSILPIVIQGGG